MNTNTTPLSPLSTDEVFPALREVLQRWPRHELTPGLYPVATPIGNLEDLSLRAIRTLQEADQIAAEDTRTAQKLLRLLGLRKPLLSLHRDNESARIPALLDALHQDQRIALISEAGSPGISDPGYLAIKATIEAGFPVFAVPGPVAAIPALLGSALPCDRFAFLGFLPQRVGRRQELLRHYQTLPFSLIFYVAPHRLLAVLEDMQTTLGDRQACTARELTKAHEDWQRGTLSQLHTHFSPAERRRGEFVLVVAGYDPDAAAQDQDEQAADIETVMDAQIRIWLAEGHKPTKIARMVTKQRSDLSRQDAYQRVLRLREEND